MSLLCSVMRVSSSGYYSWRNRGKSKREKEYSRLFPVVRSIHKEVRRSYGARRMSVELQERGFACGRHKASTVMKLAGVEAKTKKKFKITTDSRHALPISPNRLNRDFRIAKQNRAWCSDITYVWTSEGWLYLAVVIDLFSRKVVGWSLKDRMTKELVENAFLMAKGNRLPTHELIFHSDRGSQYCSKRFLQLLKSHNALSSMSRKGNCWDNAVAESFFASLKKERVHNAYYKTRKEAKDDIIDYIVMFYNPKRKHSTLEYLSPMMFEQQKTRKVA